MLAKNYNIQEREEHWRKFWQKEKIYQFNEKTKKPLYVVDTPPPYVSASHLHVGHIMSYSQAEFIVRYKRMQGFEVFYPMGFDDNGLPTERFVEKKYKINKNKVSRDEFVKLCLKETKIGSAAYKKLWQLLGISVDWSKTYSTINQHSQKISQWSFLDLYKKGKIYRARKPIMWCCNCQTALSQADLEDAEKETQLVYIKAKTETDEPVVFATTRPELLPSCVGISVHPKDKRYQRLIGQTIILPLTVAKIKMTTDEMIEPNFGTGIVYFCSSGDRQFLDWEINHPIKNKIYLLNPNGTFNEKAGPYQGLTVLEARKKIINDLEKAGAIAKIEPLTHTVNSHERCGAVIEYVDSEQWFIKLLDSQPALLKQAEKMNWRPKVMKQKYLDWVGALKWDWCISRQRYYGVPFPVWYCQKCQEVILAPPKALPVDPTIDKPPVNQCPKCKAKQIIPEKDVLDTWATSSLTPLLGAKLVKNKKTAEKLFPANLRPQAFEIIRTWLFYTVVKALYHFNALPFSDIMISGHGLDETGRKLSKRLANYQPSESIIAQYGADALRYWATGAGLGKNLRYSEDEVKKGKRTVIKLFNASQFCFQHLQNKNYSQLALEELQPEDKWLLNELNATIKTSARHFDSYAYAKAKDEIDKFFWDIFCSNYLEFVKHRLYAETNDEPAKQTLYTALLSLIKMYAPLMPFITEEIYQAYFRQWEKAKSVHLTTWPEPIKGFTWSRGEAEEFSQALAVINEIRSFKSSKNISLGQEISEFKTSLTVKEKYQPFIKKAARVKKLNKI